MFLIVLPLVNLVKAFKEYKLHRRTHRRKVHRNGKQRAQRAARHGRGDASSPGFGHAGGFPGSRRAGAGPSPFSFGGSGLGGMDPLADLFSRGFPFDNSQNPRGNLQGARISVHSIHSQHAGDQEKSSDDNASDSDSSSDSESLQEGMFNPEYRDDGKLNSIIFSS